MFVQQFSEMNASGGDYHHFATSLMKMLTFMCGTVRMVSFIQGCL